MVSNVTSETFEVDIRSAELTIVRGRATGDRQGALVLSVDELYEEREDHSILAIVHGEAVTGFAVDENCCGLCPWLKSESDTVYLGENGGVWISEAMQFRQLATELNGHELPGPLRSISNDGAGQLLAVGAALQAHASTDGRNWSRSAVPVTVSASELASHGFESVSSFPGYESYAVGWRGDLYVYDGQWSRVDLPTNLDLYAVTCAHDGNAYICGDEGLVFKGRANRWILIENSITDEKLWGVGQLGERTFVASDRLLYEIKDDELVQAVYAEDDHPPTFTNTLSVGNGVIWSIGKKQLFQFDGKSWVELFSLSGAASIGGNDV